MSEKPIKEDWILRISEWCQTRRSVNRAWIFGSRVKGSHGNNSDLDVALEILAEDGEHLAEWVFNGDSWQEELNSVLSGDVEVDLQAAFETDTIVMPAIRSHGICIYQA